MNQLPAHPPRLPVRILGPLELSGTGGHVPLRRLKARQLLLVLLTQRNRLVPRETLIDALWAGDQPSDPGAALRSYASAVHRALELTPGVDLTSERSGYSVRLAEELVDATYFERLVAMAHDPRTDDAEVAALESLDTALSLVRGRPLDEVAHIAVTSAEARRLQSLLLDARERRLELRLSLGQLDEAVAEALALTAENPYREHLWELYALGLHRRGQTTTALVAIDHVRRSLRDAFGLDVAHSLAQLERDLRAGVEPGPRLGAAVTTSSSGHQQSERAEPGGDQGTRTRRMTAPWFRDLIGRDTDLDALGTLLRVAGLTTLVGSGGVGKTRLAIEAANRAGDDRTLCWCDLAFAGTTGSVEQLVCASLGVILDPGLPAYRTLAEFVGSKPLLLVLDTCEPAAGAVGAMVEFLLARCPQLVILATSREPLHVPGEKLFEVRPLGEPVHHAAAGEEVRDGGSAAALFSLRLREAGGTERGAGLGPWADHRYGGVGEVPLAIELSARRLAFEPARVPSDARPVRQQTMRKSIEWSYRLLTSAERSVLDAVATMAGPFTLAQARARTSSAGPIGGLVSNLAALIDKSLLQVEEIAGTSSYRLPPAVMSYAVKRRGDPELSRAASVTDHGPTWPGRAPHDPRSGLRRPARNRPSVLGSSGEGQAARPPTVHGVPARVPPARVSLVRVLGPVVLDLGGNEVRLNRRKPREIFLLLLLHRGESLSIEFIADALWAGRAPDHPREGVRSYLWSIRQWLEAWPREVSGPVLRSEAGAYTLDLDDDHLDLVQFTRLATRGQRALRDGLPAVAVRDSDDALGLFRGGAFQDASNYTFADAEITRLERMQLEVRETRALAALEIGLPGSAIADLRTLADEHPYRSRSAALLMVSLYRSRRQVEANERALAFRRALFDGLGERPDTSFVALEQAILNQEAWLDDPAVIRDVALGNAAEAPPSPAPSGNGQNGPPYVVGHSDRLSPRPLLGREEAENDVESILRRITDVSIVGPIGCGKTALAARVGARIRDEMNADVVWIDVSVESGADGLRASIEKRLDNAEQDDRGSPDTILLILDGCDKLHATVDRVVGELKRRRVPGLRVLRTSRRRDQAGSFRYDLAPLAPAPPEAGPEAILASPAVALFCQRAAATRRGFEPGPDQLRAVARICEAVDRLPLWIEMAAAQTLAVSVFELERLLADDPFSVLGLGRSPNLHDEFHRSYEQLTKQHRKILGRLGEVDHPFTTDEALSVGDAPSAAYSALASLVTHSIVAIDHARVLPGYRVLRTWRAFARRSSPASQR